MRIYTDMVADLFHRGHVEFLKNIRNLYPNDYLIIGTHSDEEISVFKNKPIFNMEDRIEILKSTIFPDEVWGNIPIKITKKFIIENNIDIVIHADNMEKFHLEINYKVPIDMGILRTVPYYKEISTSKIIKKILKKNIN